MNLAFRPARFEDRVNNQDIQWSSLRGPESIRNEDSSALQTPESNSWRDPALTYHAPTVTPGHLSVQ